MTSTSTRQKKKRKKKAKRQQKMAWMVELRLAGFDKFVTDAIQEAGSYALAEQIYKRYINLDPKKVNRRTSTSTWTSAQDHIDAMRYAIDREAIAKVTKSLTQTFYKEINYGVRSNNDHTD